MNKKDYTWIKVKSYQMNDQISWEERYSELEHHHIEETNFLINKIEELTAIVNGCALQGENK